MFPYWTSTAGPLRGSLQCSQLIDDLPSLEVIRDAPANISYSVVLLRDETTDTQSAILESI